MATRLGNLFSEEYGTGFSYNVWDINDTAPTIRTFCGGGTTTIHHRGSNGKTNCSNERAQP